MNFKRIEWIFFIAFIILDIFLVYSYVQSRDMTVDSNNTVQSSSKTSILKNMREDQISYPKLSKKSHTGYYLASPNGGYLQKHMNQLDYSQSNYDSSSHQLKVRLATMVKIDSDNPTKTIDTLLKGKQVINGNEYEYNPYLSNKDVVVYSQVIYGHMVNDEAGQIRFNVKKNYISGYTQGYLDKVDILRECRQVISEEKALIWLYRYNKIQSNSTVVSIYLGYSQLLTANSNTVFIPTWVFKIKSNASGNIVYRRINGFTGAIMDD